MSPEVTNENSSAEAQKKVTFYYGFAPIMYEILPCKCEQNLWQLVCGYQLHDVYVALLVTTAGEHDSRMVLPHCRCSPAEQTVHRSDKNTALNAAVNEKLMRWVMDRITV